MTSGFGVVRLIQPYFMVFDYLVLCVPYVWFAFGLIDGLFVHVCVHVCLCSAECFLRLGLDVLLRLGGSVVLHGAL